MDGSPRLSYFLHPHPIHAQLFPSVFASGLDPLFVLTRGLCCSGPYILLWLFLRVQPLIPKCLASSHRPAAVPVLSCFTFFMLHQLTARSLPYTGTRSPSPQLQVLASQNLESARPAVSVFIGPSTQPPSQCCERPMLAPFPAPPCTDSLLLSPCPCWWSLRLRGSSQDAPSASLLPGLLLASGKHSFVLL